MLGSQLSLLTRDGLVQDGEHGGLMVKSLHGGVYVDVHLTVACQDRPGDAW